MVAALALLVEVRSNLGNQAQNEEENKGGRFGLEGWWSSMMRKEMNILLMNMVNYTSHSISNRLLPRMSRRKKTKYKT